jgi:peroxiredoxin
MRLKIFMVWVSMCAVLLTAPALSQSLSKAPNFSLKSQDGKNIELKKLRGKVVVVNFWATWCRPCKAEIPGFLDVYERYKARGLQIIGVSLDQDGWVPVKPFVAKFNITYPIVVGDGKLAEMYGGVEGIPTTFIIDKKGNIVERHMGYLSRDQFEGMIKKLL